MKFKFQENKYYVYDANSREIDKDNPMTFKEVAVSDGGANFLPDDTKLVVGKDGKTYEKVEGGYKLVK